MDLNKKLSLITLDKTELLKKNYWTTATQTRLNFHTKHQESMTECNQQVDLATQTPQLSKAELIKILTVGLRQEQETNTDMTMSEITIISKGENEKIQKKLQQIRKHMDLKDNR
jgi:hypothetical protein